MTHPRGRQPIGPNQPPHGGSAFPFLRPSPDVAGLFGDLYLQYEDDLAEFTFPFRVAWAYGFGTETSSQSDSLAEPTHARDLLIVDAENRVVCDTTLIDADGFLESPWPEISPRMTVTQWIGATRTLRVTWHVEWTAADVAAGEDRDYALHITPENGELDETTCERIPRRVRSLRTVDVDIPPGPLALVAGYNMRLEVRTPTTATTSSLTRASRRAAGTRRTTQIVLHAVPGAGLGQYPGCEGVEPTLRRLGGAVADASGNLRLDAEGCLRLQRPLGLIEADPRTFRYLHVELSPEQAAAALDLRNDCQPCCDCSYYVRVYEGIRRRWNFGQAVADDVVSARDLYVENRERWLAAKSCREAKSLQAVLIQEAECRVAAGFTHCNTTLCCLAPVKARFTFQFYDGSVESEPPGATVDCSQARISGSSQRGRVEDYALIGSWPVFEAEFDFADPQDVSRAGFRLCLAGCDNGQSVKMTVSLHAPDPLPVSADVECELPAVAVPSEIEDIWNASGLGAPTLPTRYLTSAIAPLSDRNAFCRRCEC